MVYRADAAMLSSSMFSLHAINGLTLYFVSEQHADFIN